MTRTKKLLLNITTGVGKQIATVICGFVLTRFLLLTYGSEVNGLVSSIGQFLGFISFLEMGIGPVIQSNLYKPLAEGDSAQVSRIVKSSKRFFRRIAYIFIAYIAALCFIFPSIVNTDFPPLYIVSLLLIISISTFAQYYFGLPYQLLLSADQKSYIQVSVSTITLVVNTALCIVLMRAGGSIQAVKLVTASVYVLRPALFALYVRRHYSIDRKITYNKEPIVQKWNGFAQHLAAVVTDGTDIIILTFLSSMANVSVYAVYHNVILGVENLVMAAATGLEAFWGNMIAKNEKENLHKSFSFIEFGVHTGVTLLFTVTGILLVPFIKIYTKGVTDIEYIQPLFSCILTIAFAMQCLRVPYNRMIKAAGHYKQTQAGAIISMLLNLAISIPSVCLFGLVGVACGTLAAMLFHTVYFAVYLSRNILRRPLRHFLGHIIADVIEASLCCAVCSLFLWQVQGYGGWVLLALAVCGASGAIVLLASAVLYRSEMRKLWRRIKR